MIYDHVGEKNLNDLLAERVDSHPTRAVLIYEDAKGAVSEFTYEEFQAKAIAIASGLAANGIGRGDRVVVHLSNSPEFVLAWFALARLGAVIVPSNTANTTAELVHVIGFSGAVMAITEPRFLGPVKEACGEVDQTVTMVMARCGSVDGILAFEALEQQGDLPAVDCAPTDLVQLIFTSGTTAKPKAVMLTHANCLRSGEDTARALGLQDGERCLTALPIFHVNCQAVSVLSAIVTGGTAILMQEFRASKFWSQVKKHRATQTSIVAMQLRTLLAQPVEPGEREHDVRRLFFAINVSDQEKDEFEGRFGVSLINGYGLTEAMVLVTASPLYAPRSWPSIGLPLAGRRIRLLDEDGLGVPPGEVGEIVVEGVPGRSVMLGYYNDQDSTDASLRDGWLHTGDNAFSDENGYFYFFDRKKDVIKRAGENISALEVEEVLIGHPEVAEVSVVGVPDPIRDEAVVAVVVVADGKSPSQDDLVSFCGDRLAKFKVPSFVSFRDELPKTSIGKVRKNVLRSEVSTELVQ